MKILHSLRGQIAVGVSVMLVVLWLLAVLGSAFVVKEEIDESFDAALQETAERVLPLAILELIDRDDDGTSQRVARITEHGVARSHRGFFTRPDLCPHQRLFENLESRHWHARQSRAVVGRNRHA